MQLVDGRFGRSGQSKTRLDTESTWLRSCLRRLSSVQTEPTRRITAQYTCKVLRDCKCNLLRRITLTTEFDHLIGLLHPAKDDSRDTKPRGRREVRQGLFEAWVLYLWVYQDYHHQVQGKGGNSRSIFPIMVQMGRPQLPVCCICTPLHTHPVGLEYAQKEHRSRNASRVTC